MSNVSLWELCPWKTTADRGSLCSVSHGSWIPSLNLSCGATPIFVRQMIYESGCTVGNHNFQSTTYSYLCIREWRSNLWRSTLNLRTLMCWLWYLGWLHYLSRPCSFLPGRGMMFRNNNKSVNASEDTRYVSSHSCHCSVTTVFHEPQLCFYSHCSNCHGDKGSRELVS